LGFRADATAYLRWLQLTLANDFTAEDAEDTEAARVQANTRLVTGLDAPL